LSWRTAGCASSRGPGLDSTALALGTTADVVFDDVPGAGELRYRVELIDEGGKRAVITSHSYVHAVEASGGCGCGAGSGLGGGVLPALALLAVRRRWRPIRS
jgi:hypothetical protein